jgi:hypothetical protein
VKSYRPDNCGLSGIGRPSGSLQRGLAAVNIAGGRNNVREDAMPDQVKRREGAKGFVLAVFVSACAWAVILLSVILLLH